MARAPLRRRAPLTPRLRCRIVLLALLLIWLGDNLLVGLGVESFVDQFVVISLGVRLNDSGAIDAA